jgi:hypothetical protein
MASKHTTGQSPRRLFASALAPALAIVGFVPKTLHWWKKKD